MHRLEIVQIENFRSCKKTRIPLADFTPVVGYNNAGKSNILDAIQWLLWHGSLPETDFRDPDFPVRITGEIVGLDVNVLDSLTPNRREAIESYIEDGSVQFRRIQPTPSSPKGKIKLEVRNPSVADPNADDAWANKPSGFNKTLQTIFPEPIEIGAMEDAAEDVAKSKATTTIGKLISEVLKPVKEQHGSTLQEGLAGLRSQLNADGSQRLSALDRFDREASNKVQEFFPGLEIKAHVPIPAVDELFKGGTIKVVEEGSSDSRDVEALGHGAQRSIQMALVRHLAEQQANEEATQKRTLVLIDEPELYLHPQAIEDTRSSLRALADSHYQIIFATHSPLMIGERDLPHAVIVRKTKPRSTHVRRRIADVIREVIEDHTSQRKTLFQLQNANELLFSNRVLIAEGKTERRLLPTIYESVAGRTLKSEKIGFVAFNGAGSIPKGLEILDAMNMNAKALVDLDFAYGLALTHDLLKEGDEDIVACRELHEGSGSLNSADECAKLVKSGRAEKHINNLHDKLKKKNVWLWKSGSLDDCLGIKGKTENHWADFRIDLQDLDYKDVIHQHKEVEAFARWLIEGDETSAPAGSPVS